MAGPHAEVLKAWLCFTYVMAMEMGMRGLADVLAVAFCSSYIVISGW